MEFDSFKAYLVNNDRSPATLQGYLSDLQHFAYWFEGTTGETLSPQSVTPSDIREYRQYMLTVQRYKASTVNRRRSCLYVFIDWAKKDGHIEVNPADSIRSVPQVQPGAKYLDRKEQFALQRAIEKDLQLARLRYPKRWLTRRRDASLTICLLNTGLRLHEALEMRLDNLELSERKGKLLIYGKGGKFRSVPLNAKARKALQAWLSVQPDVNGGHLWVAVESEQEGSLSSRSVQRIVQRYGQQAGIDNLTPHILRHTFAKNLVDQGVGLEKVAALLGHSSLNTTRIYITPNEKDLEKAVEKLND